MELPKARAVQVWLVELTYEDGHVKEGWRFDTKEECDDQINRLVHKGLAEREQ